MKIFFTLFSFLLFQPGTFADAVNPPEPKPGNYTVYLFLGEECIISQQYTLLINRLCQEYGSEQISFVGLFPNPSSNVEKMGLFKDKYGLVLDLKLDHLQKKMDAFGVKVTPEAVVFNENKKEVIYQGRIDNTFFRVGKRRTVTTTTELEDVLLSIKNGQPVSTKKTEAIGCYITPLDAMMKNVKMCKPEEQQ